MNNIYVLAKQKKSQTLNPITNLNPAIKVPNDYQSI